MDKGIAVFKGKEIRRTLHTNEWWFSIIDVIEALTGSDRPRKYWSDLKKKLSDEGYNEVSDKIGQLKLKSSDGKYYETEGWGEKRQNETAPEYPLCHDAGRVS